MEGVGTEHNYAYNVIHNALGQLLRELERPERPSGLQQPPLKYNGSKKACRKHCKKTHFSIHKWLQSRVCFLTRDSGKRVKRFKSLCVRTILGFVLG